MMSRGILDFFKTHSVYSSVPWVNFDVLHFRWWGKGKLHWRAGQLFWSLMYLIAIKSHNHNTMFCWCYLLWSISCLHNIMLYFSFVRVMIHRLEISHWRLKAPQQVNTMQRKVRNTFFFLNAVVPEESWVIYLFM